MKKLIDWIRSVIRMIKSAKIGNRMLTFQIITKMYYMEIKEKVKKWWYGI